MVVRFRLSNQNFQSARSAITVFAWIVFRRMSVLAIALDARYNGRGESPNDAIPSAFARW
jgi:hypothetical protein